MATIPVNPATKDTTLNLALDTIEKKKQALVFVGSKRSAEKTAEDIAKKIKKQEEDWDELSEKAVSVIGKPTKQCERLSRCLKGGVAFHHSGLHPKQKTLIEDAFRENKIKIICCTPTLAAGLDLPAYRAILKDLRRYSGKFGMQFIPVLEYLQMVGRAGRPKYDTIGEGICVVKTEAEKDEVIERYVYGEPEAIYSKLAVEPVLRTYILSLIATGFVKGKDDLLTFFEKTFWAYQFSDMAKLERKIDSMILLLLEWGFLEQKGGVVSSEFVSGGEVEGEYYRPTPLGKRVAELYLDPLTAHHLLKGLAKAHGEDIVHPFGFLQLVSHTLEMRPLLRLKAKEYDEIHEEYLLFDQYMLENEPSLYDYEYEDYLSSVKTALMLYAWINEKDEEYLYETYNVRPGETRMKVERADWLLYTCNELGRIQGYKELLSSISKLRYRLKYGVTEELLPLLKLEGVGRVRARKLFKNKLKTIKELGAVDIGVLGQIVGKALAIKIKKQLGEEVDESKIKVPKGRRSGQMSLHKY